MRSAAGFRSQASPGSAAPLGWHRHRRGSSACFLALLAGLVLFASAPAAAQDGYRPTLSADAVILMDADGRVIFDKNAEARHEPASLVKLMTLYLAFEDLKAGRAAWEEPVRVSRRAARTPRHRMGLRAGTIVPLRLLLEAIAIASANDAAVALAERLARNEKRFVARMNAKARELGLVATRFANPHGLPHPRQRSTAKDLATLTGYLLQDYPRIRAILGGKTFVYRGRLYTRRMPSFVNASDVQALKTGFTREAGYNLAVAASRDGQPFLGVVLGAPTRTHSFVDAKKLLRYGRIKVHLESSPQNGLLPRGPGSELSGRARD